MRVRQLCQHAHHRHRVVAVGVQRLAHGLLARPQLLIVDEPTEGLAPALVQTVGQVLREQADAGVAIVLMEQKLDLVPALADRVLVLGRGEVVFEGTPQSLQQAPQVRSLWLEA